MTWNDSEEIGFALLEKFPELDPLGVGFTDLCDRMIALDGFDEWKDSGQ
jgi:FeS assembly protein IscX